MTVYYSCDYCGKLFLEKEQAEHHEKECKRNPINKTCYTCKSLTEFSGDMVGLQCCKNSYAWRAECYPSQPNKECWEQGVPNKYAVL